MIVLYILLAIALLLVLITVHELGHYTAGKILKFKINEFSIGFGKAIFSKTNKKTGEKFSIRIFPLGGYCAFEGEDDAGNTSPDAFNNQKPWKRLIVLFAGVFFNFIFGILAAIVFMLVAGYSVPKINYVAPNSPNANILQVGDEIVAVNGKRLEVYTSFEELSAKYDVGQEFAITILRNGEKQEVVVQKYELTETTWYVKNTQNINKLYVREFDIKKWPHEQLRQMQTEEDVVAAIKANDGNLEGLFYKENGEVYVESKEAGIYEVSSLLGLMKAEPGEILGIGYGSANHNYYFHETLYKSFVLCGKICWLILCALGGLFTGATKVRDMGGTITAISQVAQYSRLGFDVFLYLIPVLSMNLALFNFLPIPALDGARFVFVLIEWIFKKPVPRKIEGWIHTVGLFVLLALVLFLDIFHFVA